jgi:hypothetical protein
MFGIPYRRGMTIPLDTQAWPIGIHVQPYPFGARGRGLSQWMMAKHDDIRRQNRHDSAKNRGKEPSWGAPSRHAPDHSMFRADVRIFTVG